MKAALVCRAEVGALPAKPILRQQGNALATEKRTKMRTRQPQPVGLISMIAAVTLLSGALHFLLYALLLGSRVFMFAMQIAVGFMARASEAPWEPLLRQVLLALLSPIGLFLPPDAWDNDSILFFTVLMASSILWGVGFGSLLYVFQWVAGKARRVPQNAMNSTP
jgi:hypothetical protein